MAEKETAFYDEALRLEVYRFEGLSRPFPDHFHDFYVIGGVEAGERLLTCKNRRYRLGRGDLLLLNPSDSHGCIQAGDEPLSYRALNLTRERMAYFAERATGRRGAPAFGESVRSDPSLCAALFTLCRAIERGDPDHEALLLSFLGKAEKRGCLCFPTAVPDEPTRGSALAVERACAFMERHFAEPISLDALCRRGNLSRSALLRAFTKEKGVTPYRYLQAIRIARAKEMLEAGATPLEAAMRTGFADQSHFSRFFRLYIGLSPARYAKIFREGKEAKR
ncbi:MAG: AraC family transcriptional regulator [Eubacterium sp.]|nr:AraC family transcriptional regulator [Eubacterium sp.]MCM1418000.1 AraC family transcriptional regulator [Roseburia sp.]